MFSFVSHYRFTFRVYNVHNATGTKSALIKWMNSNQHLEVPEREEKSYVKIFNLILEKASLNQDKTS